MSYDYETEKAFVFTDKGQKMLLSVRDNAFRLISIAGAARIDKILANQIGDSWAMLACVDRLVEIGDLIKLPDEGAMTQFRVLRRPYVNEENHG